MIYSRCIRNFLFYSILLSSECSSLSPSNIPHHKTTTTSLPTGESSSTVSSWSERAKQWAAAGVLSASLILVGTNNVAPAMAAEGAAAVVNPKPKVEVTVETDNLVRTLDYFEGDMKKTMGAVTAPTSSTSSSAATVVAAPTKVDATPQLAEKAPEQQQQQPVVEAAAAVKAPENPVEAAPPAAAVKPVETPAKPDVPKQTTATPALDESPLGDVAPALKIFADAVTEKKYTITLPGEEGKAGHTVMLSQLDFSIAAIVVGYPLTFGLWGQTELGRIEKLEAYRADMAKKKELGAERVKAAAAAAQKRSAQEKKGPAAAVNGGMDQKQPEQVVPAQPAFGESLGFVKPASQSPSNNAATTMEGKDEDGNAFSLNLNNPDLQQQFDGKASIHMKARIMQPGDPEGDFTITLDESMFEDVSPDAKRVVVRGRLESEDFSDEQFQ